MKSRITKFAAAAVIITASLIGLNIFNSTTVWGQICKAFEKVNCVHMVEWQIKPDGERVKGNEYWMKRPHLFRNDNPSGLTIDNGREKLEINKKHKTAQLSESDQDYYPTTDHMYAFIEMLRGTNWILDGTKPILAKITSECTDKMLVYNVYYESRQDIKIAAENLKIWVDAESLLMLRFVRKSADDILFELVFDYEDIADEMFSLDVLEEYEELAPKQRVTFRGKVVDENDEPIYDAEVYITAIWLMMHGRTDVNGEFELKAPPHPEKLMFPIFVRAFKEDEFNKVAWTVLTDPEIDKELAGGIPRCEDVRFIIDENASSFVKCAGASNIIVRMRPALQIMGTITDKAGNPIEGGRISLEPVRLNKYNNGSFVLSGGGVVGIGGPKGNPEAVTNSQGRYILCNLPKFAKGFNLQMRVTAEGYVTESTTVTLNGGLLQEGVDHILFKGGVTIEGLVTNAAGKGLPRYIIGPTVNGRIIGEVLSVTEENTTGKGTHGYTHKDGRFKLMNCPAMEGLAVTFSGSKPPDWDFWMKQWKMSEEFVPYDDKTIEVGYQEGKNRYYVEIVLDKPVK